MPIWKEVKMDLVKGLKQRSTDTTEDHTLGGHKPIEFVEGVVSNLKQCDLISRFPKYAGRHIFVKVVAK